MHIYMHNTYYSDQHMVDSQVSLGCINYEMNERIDVIATVSTTTINLCNKPRHPSGLQCQAFILMLMDLPS